MRRGRVGARWVWVVVVGAGCTELNPAFLTDSVGGTTRGGSETSDGTASDEATTSEATTSTGATASTGTTMGGPTGTSVVDPTTGTGTTEGVETTDTTGVCQNGQCQCVPGEQMPCYSDPNGTEGTGVCKAGLAMCDAMGSGFGPCVGEVLPGDEVCGNDIDEDCDGKADDGCPYPQCPQHPSLVACYPFPDDLHDALVDGSGQGHDGLAMNLALANSAANFGVAARFPESGFVTIPEQPAFDVPKLTISLLTRIEGDGFLIDNHDQYVIGYGGGKITCAVRTTLNMIPTVSIPVGMNGWLHVACSYDGTNLRLWVHPEGAPQPSIATKILAGQITSMGVNGTVLGNEGGQMFQPFDGLVDQVLLFNKALTEAELLELDPFDN